MQGTVSRCIILKHCRSAVEQPPACPEPRFSSLMTSKLIPVAGTNFLMRAKAFMEAGGSPTYTLTEDFALGMEMKKYGWQCRYVQVRGL